MMGPSPILKPPQKHTSSSPEPALEYSKGNSHKCAVKDYMEGLCGLAHLCITTTTLCNIRVASGRVVPTCRCTQVELLPISTENFRGMWQRQVRPYDNPFHVEGFMWIALKESDNDKKGRDVKPKGGLWELNVYLRQISLGWWMWSRMLRSQGLGFLNQC